MTQNEFKVGDRVSVEDSKCSGIVTAVDGMRCLVRFDNGRVMNFPKGVLQHRASHTPKDRRTAFLTELQALLRKYDAEICGGLSDISENDVVFILIGNKDKVKYLNGTSDTYAHINADNIMDFDKE